MSNKNKAIYKFQKEYSRDNSIILQEAWYQAQKTNIAPKLGSGNPHIPNNIYYINDGLIEIWENLTAIQWLKDIVLEKNLKDENFLKDGIAWHKNHLDKIKPFWEKGKLDSIKELKDFVKIVYETATSFLIFYISAINEKTPEHLRKMALEVRNNDAFFETSHEVISETLSNLYPQLRGYETIIKTEEIENPPAISELTERKKHYVLIPEIVEETTTLEDFARKHPEYEFIIEKPSSDVLEKGLKGQIAQKGLAKGTVRIIKTKDQFQNIKEGEILVTTMTTPYYLPSMKKAAAIVTDESGILCHSAIMAREFKLPCVIGTKIATRVLKDGDLVEVDADKGVVKLIKKNEL